MGQDDGPSALEVLACEIELRPKSAPPAGRMAELARRSERIDDALVVEFDVSAADEVERFAAAERRCCATLSWDVDIDQETVRLTVHAYPKQLELIEQLFTRE